MLQRLQLNLKRTIAGRLYEHGVCNEKVQRLKHLQIFSDIFILNGPPSALADAEIRQQRLPAALDKEI